MQTNVVSSPLADVACDWLILPVTQSGEFPANVAELDEALDGRLARLREAGDLTGKAGETIEIRDALESGPLRILTVGLGEPARLSRAGIYKSFMAAVRKISTRAYDHVAAAVPAVDAIDRDRLAETVALALQVGCVGQGLYRSEPERFPFQRISVASGDDAAGIRTVVERGAVVGEAVNLARELINRHAGEIYPETFAQRAQQLATEYGLGCEILDEPQLEQEKMRALLAVGRGSVRRPRVVVLEHRGAPDSKEVWGLCGKGVTFDSGGLSLKTNDGMKSMKADMSGAAAVLGTMTALARLKSPVNAIGVMGLVENMPDADSFKLGDVLTARNGVTIEVMNTDAEGRLVLADVLAYTVDRGATKLIDLATLTGACVVALGEEVAGAFSNDQPWCDAVLQAAGRAGEDLWQMPMFDSYAEQLKSEVADCKNVGTRWGGAITAAKFLQKFVGSTPWVHLDIAGPAFSDSSKPHQEGGGSGVMVRTLVELASNGA
ncbi:MAG: leucyl aminopeptidase [Planctomycetota bacterium]|nr:MAG: leucyl aminopeptidase [Planctomycetota bacterium]REK29807.1 MAG: leucyl aminopeptidase [Planctomycetota bacterium]REK30567.1 MAG: leucyl aminopeptidase [Planctomycetota bacterium]